jgi:hypothetical protein
MLIGPGAVFGRYTVERALGRDGKGQVMRATYLHPALGASPPGRLGGRSIRRVSASSGWRPQDEVFHPDAIERIAAYAEGIPRVPNQLCEAALRISSLAGIATVSPPVVDAAARQLDFRIPRRPSSAWAVIRTSATGIGVAILVSVTAALFVFWPTSHAPLSLLPAIGPVAVEQTNTPAQVTRPEPRGGHSPRLSRGAIGVRLASPSYGPMVKEPFANGTAHDERYDVATMTSHDRPGAQSRLVVSTNVASPSNVKEVTSWGGPWHT